MNLHAGNSLWNKDMGIVKKYEYLARDTKCDVLIIGGGVTGALTAYIQAKTGANVIVVEKNILGYGTTLKSDGIMLRELDVTEGVKNKLSTDSIKRYNKLCNNAVEDILNIISELSEDEECKKYIESLALKEMDMLYYSNKLFNKYHIYKMFEKKGMDNKNVEYLESDPVLNLSSGVLVPKAGFILNPYILSSLIYMYISKMKNVKIYENTSIENINSKSERIECLTNNRFKIDANCVILTCGLNTLKYLEDFMVDVYKTFSIATERITNLNSENLNIIAKNIENKTYAVTFTKDNRIILGGECMKDMNRIQDFKYEEMLEKGKYKKLYYMLNKTIPFSEPPKIDKCYSGVYIKTKDMLPIIDEIEKHPNVYCNLPVGRNKIVQSMIGANILKDISKRCHVKDMYLFRENRY